MKSRIAGLVLIAGALVVGVWVVNAQNGAPATKALSPEASKRFTDISTNYNRRLGDCQVSLESMAAEQQALLIGAEVPAEMRGNCKADGGIVTCAKRPAEVKR